MFLLNLLNELEKAINARFAEHSELNKLNNAGARMLDSHDLSNDINITLKSHFCSKKWWLCHYVHNVLMDVIPFPENL